MSKKLFKKLIKRASTPVPKEQDKQLRPDGYSEKRTRPDKTNPTSVVSVLYNEISTPVSGHSK